MRLIASIFAWLALAAILLAAALFFRGTLELDRMKAVMLAATVVWFTAAPLWMRDKQNAADVDS